MAHKLSPTFWLKLGLWIVLLLPFIRWWVLVLTDNLTANPQEFLIRSSGTWTLLTLWLTLSITPLRILLQKPWIGSVRRLCGLWSFFYASCHVLLWMAFDRGFVWQDMLADIVERPFITLGASAFLLLFLLASTSYKAAMRLLGATWKHLHQQVYLIGVLVLAHYLLHLQGKNQTREAIIYIVVFAVLMIVRLPFVRKWRQKR